MKSLKYLGAAALISLTAASAHAQALGSVHCRAALRQSDLDLKASQKKVESVQLATADEKCSAMKVHVLMLERASTVFGRCTEGRERDENIAQADASAAEARASITRSCGG